MVMRRPGEMAAVGSSKKPEECSCAAAALANSPPALYPTKESDDGGFVPLVAAFCRVL